MSRRGAAGAQEISQDRGAMIGARHAKKMTWEALRVPCADEKGMEMERRLAREKPFVLHSPEIFPGGEPIHE